MTNKEYIIEKLNSWNFQISEKLLTADLGDKANTPYSSSVIDEYFYKMLPEMLLRPTSVSEGGFSLTFNKDGMEIYYKVLCKRLNRANQIEKNTIRDISNQW